MLFQKTISPLQFKQWLRRDEENSLLFSFSIFAIAVSFIWLKFIYPFPNFMPPDSVNYIEAAYRKDFINFWPTGYSIFLRMVHAITSSHLVLVSLQYILLTVSLLYFLFTIRYLLSPGIWLFRIILILSLCNPLLPHIANFVSSDCLFATLSLLWITQLFWIMYKPNLTLLLLHALVLACLFTVRSASIYYPIFSVGIIVFTNMPKRTRLAGIASVGLLILVVIGYTQYEYKRKTGIVQYSAFGGWQLAANALYSYSHARPDDPAYVRGRFKKLHTAVNQHLDSLSKLKIRPDEEIGIYYLWSFQSPLRTYMRQVTKDTTKRYFYRWARMGPLYGAYGWFLIARHPGLYVKHFVWPNLKRYFLPPPYFMGYYNMGIQYVNPEIKRWFQWESNRLPTENEDRKIEWMHMFSVLFAVINLLFFILGLICIGGPGFKLFSAISRKLLLISFAIVLVNGMFGACTAPIELRYELFPFIIMVPLVAIYISYFISTVQLLKWQTRLISS
jgi:hypothetical protein